MSWTLATSLVTAVWIVVLCLCYKPLMGFLRVKFVAEKANMPAVRKGVDNTRGRKNYKYTGRKKEENLQKTSSESTAYEKTMGVFVLSLLIFAAFLIRVVAGVLYKGYESDMNCFILWADQIFEEGIPNFYLSDSFTDYPPGYMYILYVIGFLRAQFGIVWDSTTSVIMTKMPSILCDIATGYLVYRAGCRHFKEVGAALLAGLYLLCPMIILDSAIWGQTDSVYVFFLVLMTVLVTEKKLIPSYFAFAIAILIKPQSLIFTPVLIVAIIDQIFLDREGYEQKQLWWKRFWVNLSSGISAILLIGVLMLPFGFKEALKQYTETLGSYEYASVNSYNLWTLLGMNWKPQKEKLLFLSCQQWGTVALVVIVVGIICLGLRCRQTASKYYFLSGAMVTLVFFFSVRMHERYIFPAAVMFLLACAMRPKRELYILFAAITAIAYMNMSHVLFLYGVIPFDYHDEGAIFISVLMLCAVAYLIWIAVSLYGRNVPENVLEYAEQSAAAVKKSGRAKVGKNQSIVRPSAVLAKMERKDYIALALIMLVYGVIAFVRLGNLHAPQTEYSVLEQGPIVLDMGQETTVEYLWNFLGVTEEKKYYVEYADDMDGDWEAVMVGDSAEWESGSVFNWNSLEIGVTARYFRIRSVDDGYVNDGFLELVLTDMDGSLLRPVNAGEYPNLFDEQDLFEGRDSCLNGTYFDEIYHARTAYEMINKLYCYETTHPPLGKVFIAVGILLFGMNPFGWRFSGTLFGVLMLPIIYNFAKKFFKESWISVVTTLLFAFDFMHFVQTRIATIDVFVTLFIMLSYYFMYCYTQLSFYDTPLKKTFVPLGLCGIAMGFSWACKWTGIYSSAGLCILFFVQMGRRFWEYSYAVKHPEQKSGDIAHSEIISSFYKKFFKTIGFCCIFFILVPAVIYVLSYIPFNDGTNRGLLEKIIVNQQYMFDYHSGLKDGHDFGSKWYQWPIMYRPMWYYSGSVSDTLREGISSFGNPLVWWAGIPAFVFMLYLMFYKKDRGAAFLTVGYLSQYAPWFFVTRVIFIYHYFPSVPFVTVMVSYSLYKIVQWRPEWKRSVYIYVGVAIALFILFYPVLSGLAITPEFAKRWLKWFPSWVLLDTWS